jgi:hypothetical protein
LDLFFPNSLPWDEIDQIDEIDETDQRTATLPGRGLA